MTVAALYVESGGVYCGLPGVEPWAAPEADARWYAGPYPVVAHPPCARWCQLAGLVQHRWGHRVGDDGGAFSSALHAVRCWGGVLEHPAHSKAWPAYGLPTPPRGGGWARALDGGWVCHVEQGHYGHPARKATWLYAVGCELPSLRWGCVEEPEALVSWCANRVREGESRRRVGKAEASRTPEAFREVLLSMARSVRRPRGGL